MTRRAQGAEVLAALADQLRYEPPVAALRQLERAEALADEIEPDGRYPSEWLVFRVTGYRPDTPPPGPSVVVGAEALAGLPELVDALSVRAGITDELLSEGTGGGRLDDAWPSLGALAAQWGMSAQALSDLRPRGLVARRSRGPDGRWRRRVRAAHAQRFAEAHGLAGAPRVRRVSRAEALRIARLAERAQRRFGWSVGQTARALAERTGRSPQAVRRAIARCAVGPLGERLASGRAAKGKQAWAFERWSRGEPVSEIARRMGVTRAAATRTLHRERVARLCSALDEIDPEPPSIEDALVSARDWLVRREAGGVLAMLARAPRDPATLAGALDEWSHATPPNGATERTAAAHARALLAAARGALDADDAASRLDEVETALRTASRLRAAVIAGRLGVVTTVARSRGLREPARLPPTVLARLWRVGLAAAARGVRAFESGRASGAGGPVNLAMDRAVVRLIASLNAEALAAATDDTRAAERLPDDQPIADWRLRVDPWQAWLEAPAGVLESARRAPGDPACALVLARFGDPAAMSMDPRAWPRTTAEAAAACGVTPAIATRSIAGFTRRRLGPSTPGSAPARG